MDEQSTLRAIDQVSLYLEYKEVSLPKEEQIIGTIHHPYMAQTPIQLKMASTFQEWVNGLGNRKDSTMALLTKVREDFGFSPDES